MSSNVAFHTLGCKLNFAETSTIGNQFVEKGFSVVDFKEEADSKFFRLSIGQEVRLKSAYIIKAESIVKDADGTVLEIHCSYDSESKSGSGTEASQRKVKSTIHWVSVAHAIQAEVREYDRLFLDESPDTHESKSYMDFINPNSLKVIKKGKTNRHEIYTLL